MNLTRWPQEHETLLRVKAADGLSAGQIARELGVSRDAVLGKARRLKLRWRARERNRLLAQVAK